MTKGYIGLFLMAFVQVFLISCQTYFIAKKTWIGIAVFSFSLNYVWCANVTAVHASTQKERLVYSSGAMFGAVIGVWLVSLLIR